MLTLPLPIADLERVLVELGALKESDVRLKKRSDSDEDDHRRGAKKPVLTNNDDDDDDDWD